MRGLGCSHLRLQVDARLPGLKPKSRCLVEGQVLRSLPPGMGAIIGRPVCANGHYLNHGFAVGTAVVSLFGLNPPDVGRPKNCRPGCATVNRRTALNGLGPYLLVEAAELAQPITPVILCLSGSVESGSAAARAWRRWQSVREDREVFRVPVSVGVRHRSVRVLGSGLTNRHRRLVLHCASFGRACRLHALVRAVIYLTHLTSGARLEA
jgi:hypothetical protein